MTRMWGGVPEALAGDVAAAAPSSVSTVSAARHAMADSPIKKWKTQWLVPVFWTEEQQRGPGSPMEGLLANEARREGTQRVEGAAGPPYHGPSPPKTPLFPHEVPVAQPSGER